MSAQRGRPLVPAVRVPEIGLGPAMIALSPAQRAFVFAKVFYGMSNAGASQAAGYSASTRVVARVNGHRLAHDERVQAAILEESRKLMRTEGPRSIRTLIKIRDDAGADKKDRLKAAVELLNRSGLNAVTEHHLTVEHLTDAQKDQRILALCQELGLPDSEARKLLIAPEAIEGEFTEIEPEARRTPEQVERAERYARTNEREKQASRRAMSPNELAAHKAQVAEAHRTKMREQYADAQTRRSVPPPDDEGIYSTEGIEDLL